MTIRHAIFIDGAWTDANANTWNALVTVDKTGIEIEPYCDSDGMLDAVRLSFEELAAIVEMVDRQRALQGFGALPPGEQQSDVDTKRQTPKGEPAP